MSNRDEALRALEKKWRDDGRGCEESGVFGPPLVLYRCADELAAILSARQEVAPVAEVCTVVGPGEKGVRIRWMGGFPKIGTKLYTSPAQTSEARDAARYRFLRDADVTQLDAERSWMIAYDAVGSSMHPDIIDAHVDAAMRQEAGDV